MIPAARQEIPHVCAQAVATASLGAIIRAIASMDLTATTSRWFQESVLSRMHFYVDFNTCIPCMDAVSPMPQG
jgi:hypothetical protein